MSNEISNELSNEIANQMMTQEALMQWIILLPLLAIPGILLFHKKQNLREAATLIVGALLLFAVIAFYQSFDVHEIHVNTCWLSFLLLQTTCLLNL